MTEHQPVEVGKLFSVDTMVAPVSVAIAVPIKFGHLVNDNVMIKIVINVMYIVSDVMINIVISKIISSHPRQRFHCPSNKIRSPGI